MSRIADAQKVNPSQSLYVQNLPEKLQKDDLRRALYMLFSTYGPVLDVNALKTPKMRGQAHILFRDVQSATQALRACQGFEFFGREMRISYSSNRSDTLAKLTGTFNPSKPAEKAKQVADPAPSAFPPPPTGAAPSALPPPPTGMPAAPKLPPPGALPAKVAGPGVNLAAPEKDEEVASPQGTKRAREESDDEGDAPMDEDEDSGGEMEMSDDDD